ncbi:MAG: hypothetical protein ACREE6_04585, partial [Limisphaerales bacterium]
PQLASIQSAVKIRFPDTTTDLPSIQSPSNANHWNIENSKVESPFPTVSCILHTLRMSRLVLHRNQLKFNDILPPAPHGSSEELSKIFPIDGGTDLQRFFLTYVKNQNIQLPDRAGAAPATPPTARRALLEISKSNNWILRAFPKSSDNDGQDSRNHGGNGGKKNLAES